MFETIISEFILNSFLWSLYFIKEFGDGWVNLILVLRQRISVFLRLEKLAVISVCRFRSVHDVRHFRYGCLEKIV